MKHSNKNSKKLFTEAGLWLLFLFISALLGYFQGLEPNFKVTDYIIKPTEIHILTISEHFFPQEVINEIEKSTHTRVIISSIENWNQLKMQLISSPSPEIVFIPSHWAQALQKEEILNTDPAIKVSFSRDVSTDFAIDTNFFLPTYWAQLSLLSTNTNANGKSLSFIKDADLFLSYFPRLPKNNYTFVISNLDLWFKDSILESTDISLIPHTLAGKHPHWKKIGLADAFYQVGFSLSKNNQHLKESIAVLEYYTQTGVQAHLLKNIPFASTLKSINKSSLAADKKSSFLRTLDFNKLIIIKSKEGGAESKAQGLTGSLF